LYGIIKILLSHIAPIITLICKDTNPIKIFLQNGTNIIKIKSNIKKD